jgi:hypothetical protein
MSKGSVWVGLKTSTIRWMINFDSAGIPQKIRQRPFTTNVRQLSFTLITGNFGPHQPPPTTPGEFELYYDV